jgi:hypothetical protein
MVVISAELSRGIISVSLLMASVACIVQLISTTVKELSKTKKLLSAIGEIIMQFYIL